MLKVISKEKNEVISAPFNHNTWFYVEQDEAYDKDCPYYTVIDVAYDVDTKRIYILLENNVEGEDDMLLIRFPIKGNILFLKRTWDNERGFGKQSLAIFIKHKYVMRSGYGDDIITMLEDTYPSAKFECLTDEEVNEIL